MSKHQDDERFGQDQTASDLATVSLHVSIAEAHPLDHDTEQERWPSAGDSFRDGARDAGTASGYIPPTTTSSHRKHPSKLGRGLESTGKFVNHQFQELMHRRPWTLLGLGFLSGTLLGYRLTKS